MDFKMGLNNFIFHIMAAVPHKILRRLSSTITIIYNNCTIDYMLSLKFPLELLSCCLQRINLVVINLLENVQGVSKIVRGLYSYVWEAYVRWLATIRLDFRLRPQTSLKTLSLTNFQIHISKEIL